MTSVFGFMAVSKQSQFDALVRATSGELYRFAFWLCGQDALAQDLVQETYLRAWRSLDDLRDTAAAKAWLITILRRENARLYERKTPALESLDAAVDLADLAPSPESGGDTAVVRRAVAQLPPKYREPLLLQVIGGLSCEEIAVELNLTAGAVMTQVFRARQKLRAVLGGHGEEGKVYELP